MSVVGGTPAAEVSPTDTIEVPTRNDAWSRFARNRSAMAGAALLLLLILAAVAAPLLATHDPLAIPKGDARLSPGTEHWFGTDQLGRDMFSRVLYGARNSLVIGFGAALLATAIGSLVGAVAGYRRGLIDTLVMRVTDMFLIFPAILLAAALAIALGRGITTLIVVLSLVGWPMIARVARSTVIAASEEEWVEAARAIGCSRSRILFRHVFPHALSPVVVVGLLYVSTAIIAEATLSFLAIGIVEPTPSWGLMIAGGRATLSSAPHIVLFPAAALLLTVISLLMITEGIRDALGVEE